jgi:hypothetical protein
MLVRLHSAAIKIQFSFRKFVKEPLRPKRIQVAIGAKMKSSTENLKLSSRDGTAQSLRKVPALDLDRLAHKKQAEADKKEEIEVPINSSRSIFARHTLQGFLEKLGVGSLDDLSP